MTTAETRRLHERLDEIFIAVAEVKTSTAIIVERCTPCHKEVMGDGQPGLATRVTLLETSATDSGKTATRRNVWVATVTSGFVVGVVLTVARALLPLREGIT